MTDFALKTQLTKRSALKTYEVKILMDIKVIYFSVIDTIDIYLYTFWFCKSTLIHCYLSLHCTNLTIFWLLVQVQMMKMFLKKITWYFWKLIRLHYLMPSNLYYCTNKRKKNINLSQLNQYKINVHVLTNSVSTQCFLTNKIPCQYTVYLQIYKSLNNFDLFANLQFAKCQWTILNFMYKCEIHKLYHTYKTN